jgi:diketogulonate reductase-like aldo/keto reductase
MKGILHPGEAPKNFDMYFLDIYLVHGPIHVQSIATIVKNMADCVEKGMAKTVGVANYSRKI